MYNASMCSISPKLIYLIRGCSGCSGASLIEDDYDVGDVDSRRNEYVKIEDVKAYPVANQISRKRTMTSQS